MYNHAILRKTAAHARAARNVTVRAHHAKPIRPACARTARRAPAKLLADYITFFISKMLPTEQRIAKSQAGRNPVFPHQSKNIAGGRLTGGIAINSPSAAPKTVPRRAVNRRNIAPVVKPVPLLAPERKKNLIKIEGLKEPWKMKMCNQRLISSRIGVWSWRGPESIISDLIILSLMRSLTKK